MRKRRNRTDRADRTGKARELVPVSEAKEYVQQRIEMLREAVKVIGPALAEVIVKDRELQDARRG